MESGVVIYRQGENAPAVDVRLSDESVWMTQSQLAQLYDTTQQNISLHVRGIYADGELDREATYKNYLLVREEGGRTVQRNVDHYNLDIILAVGYRVKSPVATQFRIWATQRLREYLVKGFVLDDERLKGHDRFAQHFDELLARIRDIRASEARAYQRVREIFSLAVDYQPSDGATQLFFASMQNKMHYAATGHTAAELIALRANPDKPNMGLTAWKGSQVRKSDVTTAKNYLAANEIDILNRIVVMFLDQAEFRTLRRQNIRTADWEAYLDKFLVDNELPVLQFAGEVSRDQAKQIAQDAYEQFARDRREKAESEADKRYLDDLRQSAATLEKARKGG